MVNKGFKTFGLIYPKRGGLGPQEILTKGGFWKPLLNWVGTHLREPTISILRREFHDSLKWCFPMGPAFEIFATEDYTSTGGKKRGSNTRSLTPLFRKLGPTPQNFITETGGYPVPQKKNSPTRGGQKQCQHIRALKTPQSSTQKYNRKIENPNKWGTMADNTRGKRGSFPWSVA